MSSKDRLLVRVPLQHHPPSFQLRIVHPRNLLELPPRLAAPRRRVSVEDFGIGQISQLELALLIVVVQPSCGFLLLLQ